jgi:GT2 family glycosyltransferase
MTVTAIIVNFNSGPLLVECLKHLQAQTVQPEKIIVVDNASADHSVDGVSAFPNVHLFKLNENTGFAGGNNFALAHADTEFVALLNPDAFPEPDWLEHLMLAVAEYPDAVAFGSRQLCQSDSTILDGIGDNYHISGLVWREGYGLAQQTRDLIRREIFSPCAAAALYRRQALVDVGGFDENYFCYVEDVDLGFRLRLAGHKSVYVPEAVVHHVGSATTGGQHSNFSVYYGHRNLVWTFVKNMPSALFWPLLPLHLLLNLVTLGVYIFRGQGLVISRSKKDAICGLPQAWKKRKRIQADRVAKTRDIWRLLDKRLVFRTRG